jgi:hypothetical protein
MQRYELGLRRCVQAPLDLGITRYQRFTERHQFGTATAFATGHGFRGGATNAAIKCIR